MEVAWRRAWDQVIPFLTFPPRVRRIVYTTNATEIVHSPVGAFCAYTGTSFRCSKPSEDGEE